MAAAIAAASCSHNWVDPTMSVNKNVTVPANSPPATAKPYEPATAAATRVHRTRAVAKAGGQLDEDSRATLITTYRRARRETVDGVR